MVQKQLFIVWMMVIYFNVSLASYQSSYQYSIDLNKLYGLNLLDQRLHERKNNLKNQQFVSYCQPKTSVNNSVVSTDSDIKAMDYCIPFSCLVCTYCCTGCSCGYTGAIVASACLAINCLHPDSQPSIHSHMN